MKKKNVAIGAGVAITAGAIAAVIIRRNRATIPGGVKAVKPFHADKYLGQWHEIARFDYRYEKDGLSHVTAEYTRNYDGTIHVLNRGYDVHRKKWESASGKAKFVKGPGVGMLKVSFFGPFYSGYNVVEIDEEYRYALVVGRSLDYLWLLSREKTMPKNIEQAYLDKAKKMGFDLSRLSWTDQG